MPGSNSVRSQIAALLLSRAVFLLLLLVAWLPNSASPLTRLACMPSPARAEPLLFGGPSVSGLDSCLAFLFLFLTRVTGRLTHCKEARKLGDTWVGSYVCV